MAVNKPVIAYILGNNALDSEDKLFLKHAKKNNVQLLMFNISKKLDEEIFIDAIKKCDLVYNSIGDEYVAEYTKTAEELGKLVIDSPKTYYFIQDKWMFYIKCRENGIPTPSTILLSNNIQTAKQELKEFSRWPVIIKRTSGTMGEFVEKADNMEQAETIINKFWAKNLESIPIIAQEFIYSPSYRVTVIGDKIVQTVIKKGRGLKSWKATGVFGKKFDRVPVDEELSNIVKKIVKVCGIKICGVDLCKKSGRWMVVEVNSEPAFNFFPEEQEKLVSLTVKFLKDAAMQELAKRTKLL